MRTAAFGALLALVLPHLAAAAGEAWWSDAWAARRTYEVTGTRSELPGDEVGVVEFRSGGLSAEDGRDVRVVSGGRVLPCRVLATGPGDLVRACFPLTKEVTGYTVYWGNPKARAGESFEPQRGLLLESRGYRGGAVDSWRAMQGTMRRAEPYYGADFVDRVFFGYNPLGPQTAYVNKYTGWLVVPEDGEYSFATSSDDASFLFVNGTKVVEWPGWHEAVSDARHSGKIALKKGLVKLEYHHVNGQLTGLAVAAWQPPGAKAAATIPAEAFAPVRRGRQLRFELRDGTPAADFELRAEGEAYLDENTWLVRAAFEARLGADGRSAARDHAWDFGDGQKGTGALVEHVYLKPGVYAVKLSATVEGRKVSCANRVEVDRDYRRATAGRSESLERYAPALAGLDLAALSPADLLLLSRVYEDLERTPDRLRLARAILSRGKDFSDGDYFDQLMVAVAELREARSGAAGREEALRLLDAAEERFKSSGARQQGYRAKAIRERGDIYYFYLGDLDKAYNEYDKVVTRFKGLEDNIVRITKIRLGDIHRERGAYAEAARRYGDAEKLKLEGQRGSGDEARRGALPQIAENFLARRSFEECEKALNIWEWEYPMEKLRGYSTLLRVRLESERRNWAEAVKQAEALLRVNPGTTYAGALLFAEARAQKAQGRMDLAAECLKRIVEKYPECEEAAEARKALEKLPPGKGSGKPGAPGGK